MKIVIDVDMDSCVHDAEGTDYFIPDLHTYISENMLEVLKKKGKVFPKGHGRLIVLSETKLKENQINLDFSCQKWISEVGLSYATVAIIEEDKDEERKKLWMFGILYDDTIKEKTEQWTKEAEEAGMTLTEYLESISPLNHKEAEDES